MLQVQARPEVAAILYSLVEGAELVGLEPAAYSKAAAPRFVGEAIPLPQEIADR